MKTYDQISRYTDSAHGLGVSWWIAAAAARLRRSCSCAGSETEQEPKDLSPPPISGFRQAEENTEKHRKAKNSLAAEALQLRRIGNGGLGNFTSKDFDICLRSFCSDSSSPQVSAKLVAILRGKMTVCTGSETEDSMRSLLGWLRLGWLEIA